ncbi:MAG TPA: hypothetical protein VK760_02490 [Candidatus Acidoferrales bacterium]|jgi:DNA-binding beta-propeller fold protein YncE|nr:hypothetical protein [Candidatus Acidoferrales bacterium]
MNVRIVAALACSALLASCASAGSNQEPVPVRASQAAMQPHWVRTSLGKFADPYGVAVNPHCSSQCTVYVADPGSKMVYKITPDGTKSAIATFDSNFDPLGVTVQSDGGSDRVYIADKGPNVGTRVWDVNVFGNSYVCCNGHNAYAGAYPLYNRGVAVFAPPTGGFALYAAQASHHPLTEKGRVECRIHFKTCAFAGTTFSDPYAVAVDGKGALYVADARDKKAYRVVGGNATDLGKTFADPYGIAASLDGGTVYVADAGDKNVWERTSDGSWSVVERFADPYGVAVDAAGVLYVADPGSKEVWKLTRG